LSNTQDLPDALAVADHIVVGVRPQDDIAGVAQLIKQYAAPQASVISIIAGVTLAQLSVMLGESRPITRIIPVR
jgi:pyrroline-5-carboxylate reductase